MTRKITTILLALALCLTLLPVGAGAAASSPSGVELKMDGDTLMYGDNNVDTTGDTGLQVTFDPSNENCIATVHGYVLNGGTYKLGDDVTIDKPLLIKGTSTNPTTLDLNGHVLKYENATQKSSVIVVADSAYFVLQDSEPNREHHFTKNDSTGLYTLSNDASSPITLTGGVITGGTGTKCGDNDFYGGGVFVGSKANFTMTGGNIVGCTATSTAASTAANSYAYGGGVFVAAGKNDIWNQQNNVYTKFTMTGGSIVGCTAASTAANRFAYGGGVYVRGYADFTMNNNARIANCTATSGGGVYNIGTFTMKSGTIENCTASSSSGGVYNYGTFTMENGTIENCTATNGGGVYVDYNSFTMKGGTIKNCTATNGDGMYIRDTSMDAQGGSVYGAVIVENSSTLENTSADGSTIFYPDTNGNAIVMGVETVSIAGKQVTFMNGETLYAETVAADGGKISAPVAPTKDGKAFLGWFTKNAVTGNEVYQKCEFTNGTAPVPAGDTLYAFWEGDFEVYATCDVNPSRNGYYETFAEAWNTSTGVDGETCTFKLLKDVPNAGSLTRSNKNTTLDLNGHTLTGSSNIPAGNSTMPKSFTVTDTSAGKNGRFDGTITVAENDAQLTVSGGTVNKVVVGNGGTLDCIGGTITTLTVTGGTVNHTGGTASCTAKAVCTVCNTSYGELAAHTGGTATCKEQAKCSVCHQPYGSKDPSNHVSTPTYQHDKDGHWQVYSCCNATTAKAAHDFDSGNTCVCGYEKPRRVYRGSAPTISAVLSHPDAASATNYTSGIYGLTFRSTASFSSFRGVQVDGKTIASTNYIAEEGSIVVYLKAVYLQTLPKGTHTVTILSTEGNATMDFTIGAVQSAKTGDPGVAIYALMALTSYTGTALVVRGRKRK